MEKNILSRIFFILFFSISLTNNIFANAFVKSKIRLGELKLTFESNIDRVTYFKLPQSDGTSKYVYDIYGATLPLGKGISHHTFRTIESFRIGQHTPTVLRVVIKSKERDLNRHEYRGKNLFIPLIYGLKSTPAKDRENSSIEENKKPPKLIKEESILDKITTHKEENNSSSVVIKRDRVDIRKKIIVIDAGHGGKDVGAICCSGRQEKKVVLSVALKLKRLLEKEGYKIYMTRDNDTFVKLPKRTEFANDKRADIFVSVHANAAPNRKMRDIFKGLEVYYLSPAKTNRAKKAAEKENAVMFEGKDFYTKNAYLSLISREKIVESHKLALDVSKKMVSTIQTSFGAVSDSGVKTANFWVLVGAQMPAILVETGYITHPKEGENLMNNYYQTLLAKGIAKGIDRYLSYK